MSDELNLVLRLEQTQWQQIFSSPQQAQIAENNAHEAAQLIVFLQAQLAEKQAILDALPS